MNSAFEMYVGVGKNAKLNTVTTEKRKAYEYDKKVWKNEWNEYFTERRDPWLANKYQTLVSFFLRDIALSTIVPPKPPQ